MSTKPAEQGVFRLFVSPVCGYNIGMNQYQAMISEQQQNGRHAAN
jgi:hypothetical protein